MQTPIDAAHELIRDNLRLTREVARLTKEVAHLQAQVGTPGDVPWGYDAHEFMRFEEQTYVTNKGWVGTGAYTHRPKVN